MSPSSVPNSAARITFMKWGTVRHGARKYCWRKALLMATGSRSTLLVWCFRNSSTSDGTGTPCCHCGSFFSSALVSEGESHVLSSSENISSSSCKRVPSSAMSTFSTKTTPQGVGSTVVLNVLSTDPSLKRHWMKASSTFSMWEYSSASRNASKSLFFGVTIKGKHLWWWIASVSLLGRGLSKMLDLRVFKVSEYINGEVTSFPSAPVPRSVPRFPSSERQYLNQECSRYRTQKSPDLVSMSCT
mmetsp:Transcript_58306/g.167340  ORF Transcript_58306/g.167340 Transcript_58306/m.167340 type:complete len:244 (+) Transcript_58306:699-1430(+)